MAASGRGVPSSGMQFADKSGFSVGGGIGEKEVEDLPPYTAMVFSAIFIAEALSCLLTYMLQVRRPSKTEQAIWKQYKTLEQEADALTTPDTFVEGAKRRRLANAKKKELEDFRRMKAAKLSLWRRTRMIMPYVTRWGAYSFLACWFWHFPISVVPPELLAPVGHFLTFPEGPLWVRNGGVSIIPFLAMSSLVCSSFLTGVAALRK